MITSVVHRPVVYSQAWSPMIWQVTSDKNTQIDFKYVFDIYINGTLNNRVLQRANPAGYGLIDVSTFCQNTLDVGNNLIEVLGGETGSNSSQRSGTDICGEVYVKVGEEYRGTTGGQLTIYNGVGNTAGAPAYWLGPAADGNLVYTANTGTTGQCIFTSGYQDSWQVYELETKGFSATEFKYSSVTGHTGLFMSTYPQGPNVDLIPYGTTGAIRVMTAQVNDQLSLTYRNSVVGNTGGQPRYISYQFVSGTGSVLGTVTDLIAWGTGTTGAAGDVVQFACGPNDPIIKNNSPSGTDAYSVQVAFGASGQTGASEKIYVKLVEPDCWGFGRWRFSWLNSVGGRDWYNFVKQNTDTYQADRTTYYKVEPYYSSGVYGATASISPALYGDTVSSNTIAVRHTAMSDWVTPEISEYLKELFTSSHVLAWDPDDRGPFLAQINSTTYEVKNYAREKMFNYTIDFTIGQPVNAQFA